MYSFVFQQYPYSNQGDTSYFPYNIDYFEIYFVKSQNPQIGRFLLNYLFRSRRPLATSYRGFVITFLSQNVFHLSPLLRHWTSTYFLSWQVHFNELPFKGLFPFYRVDLEISLVPIIRFITSTWLCLFTNIEGFCHQVRVSVTLFNIFHVCRLYTSNLIIFKFPAHFYLYTHFHKVLKNHRRPLKCLFIFGLKYFCLYLFFSSL